MPENDIRPARKGGMSVTHLIVIFASILFALFSSLVLYIALGNLLFGIQIATIFVYTGVVWAYTFLHTNLGPGYRLSDPTVKRSLPRLLLLHLAFLVLLFTYQTVLFALKPHLPPSWLKESGPKHDSGYKWLALLPPILIGATQILWSRLMLHRSFVRSLGESK